MQETNSITVTDSVIFSSKLVLDFNSLVDTVEWKLKSWTVTSQETIFLLFTKNNPSAIDLLLVINDGLVSF